MMRFQLNHSLSVGCLSSGHTIVFLFFCLLTENQMFALLYGVNFSFLCHYISKIILNWWTWNFLKDQMFVVFSLCSVLIAAMFSKIWTIKYIINRIKFQSNVYIPKIHLQHNKIQQIPSWKQFIFIKAVFNELKDTPSGSQSVPWLFQSKIQSKISYQYQ